MRLVFSSLDWYAHLSALKNFANIIALASEPPLPIVDTLSFLFIPWNPVIIGIPSFSLLYFIEQFSEPHIILRVEGHQWYWHYNIKQLPPINLEETDCLFDSYMIPSDSLKLGQLRLLEVDNKEVFASDSGKSFDRTLYLSLSVM